jgi:hypothetical protein
MNSNPALVSRYLSFSLAWVLLLARAGEAFAASPDANAGIEFFEKEIRPILVDHCYGCHSSQAEKGIKGGLNLETSVGLRKGGENGPAIVPGDPEHSLLIKAVRYGDEHLQMPPKDKKLPALQIQNLEAWVKMGAPDPRTGAVHTASTAVDPKSHWAFKPIVSPAVPAVKNQSQVQTAVDAFLLARLEPKGLKLSPQADRRTLIRRAFFDLTGLPPSPTEVERFLDDKSPDAFRRVIDQLLDSPAYGERWSRYWLDIARYADTKGYVFEEERRYPYSYTYRDYVIRAFNEDLPYDRFLKEQLAADQLTPGEDKRALAAMGFLTLGRRFLNNQADIIDDRIDVVTRGMMGLTVGCARCHDHKSDPISIKDYYSLYGVFASSHEPAEKPLLGKSALPKEYPQYVEERKKRLDERAKYREEQDAEALRKVTAQFGDYLLVARDASKLSDGEAKEKLARERKLEPVVANKFRQRYEAWSKEPPAALIGWFAFSSLSDTNFAEASKALVANQLKASLTGPSSDYWMTNTPPKSLREVADRYNECFKRSADAKGATNSPTGSPFPEVQELLASKENPLVLNPDELHRLFPTPVQQKLRALQRKIDELDAVHAGAPPRAMAMMDNDKPHEPVVFKRGNPGNPGEKVPRQFLEVLSGPDRRPFQKGSGRLEMAEAIASADNPLTARVWVNRVWNYHFGTPLARTPSDFGLRSDPPSHPELLDFLASTFIKEGWSVKKLHRLLMMSSAYQQSSDDRPQAVKADPGNHLYWKQNRRRLDFESMRDTLLDLSGKLDRNGGGQPVDITTEPFATKRTVYGFVERQNLPGLFRTFDFASPDTSSSQRFSTTVPQQALFLMNSPFVVDKARGVVEREDFKKVSGEEAQIRHLYALIYQRSPEPEEIRWGKEFLKQPASEPPPEIPAWQYGYGSIDLASGKLEKFTPLPHFNNYSWQGGKELPDSKLGWVLLNAEGGHPGKNPGLAAVRRWTAPRAGTVHFKGELNHPSEQGDGVRATVLLNGQRKLGEWTAHHSSTNTILERIKVKEGDTIDFVTDARANESFDSFQWIPRLKYTGASNSDSKEPSQRSRWQAKEDFSGPQPPKQKGLSAMEKYAQVLLLANETFFVD